jgi:Xaa-Pro aminopeptidase
MNPASIPQETPNIKRPTPFNIEGIPTPTGDIGPEIYRERRHRLMEEIGTGVAIIFSADYVGDGERQDLDFYYLTGLEFEYGAALLLCPEHDNYKEMLFLRTLDVEDNRWHGNRPIMSRAIELGVGIAHVKRMNLLPRMLVNATLATAERELVYLGPVVGYTSPIPKQLQVLRDVSSRILNARIRDAHELLPRMRSVHDEGEIQIMRRAVDITIGGFKKAMRAIEPEMNESALQHVFESHFRSHDSHTNAYPPIVGSGLNSCVLHYGQNRKVMREDELVLCDVGCEYQMYASDITRTYPVSGRFTPRQAEVYTVVLNAWKAAVAAVRPGVTWWTLNQIARAVIDEAGYCDDYFHSLGHFVGLNVHDAGLQSEPLKAGMVITIEPGIYIASEEIGIRIEDDILVTEEGCEVLSQALPREIDEIEAFMADRS